MRETRLLAPSGRGRAFTQPTSNSVVYTLELDSPPEQKVHSFVGSPSSNPQQHPSFIFFFSRLNRRGFHFLNWRQIAVGGNKRRSVRRKGATPANPRRRIVTRGSRGNVHWPQHEIQNKTRRSELGERRFASLTLTEEIREKLAQILTINPLT